MARLLVREIHWIRWTGHSGCSISYDRVASHISEIDMAGAKAREDGMWMRLVSSWMRKLDRHAF